MDPIRADLAAIYATGSIEDLVALTGRLQRQGVSGFYGVGASSDAGQPDRNLLTFLQSGLGLPDESYYREEKFAELCGEYRVHLGRLLALAEVPDAEEAAAAVVELETALAAHHWDRVKTRDAQARYNLLTGTQLRALHPPSRRGWTGRHRREVLRRGRRLAAQLPAGPRKGPGGAAARGLAALARGPAGPQLRPVPFRGVRRGELLLLLRQARRRPGAAGALEARRRASSRARSARTSASSTSRSTSRTAPRSAMDELVANLIEAYRAVDRDAGLDGPETRSRALEKLSHVRTEDRLPGQVDRLHRAARWTRRPDRQRRRRARRSRSRRELQQDRRRRGPRPSGS